MTNLRTGPFTASEIDQYREQGYLFPVRVLTEAHAIELRAAINEHLEGAIASKKYELTDPIRIRQIDTQHGRVQLEYEGDDTVSKPHTFGFLFNLWKTDDRFARIGKDPVIAGLAGQLLGAKQLLLMEDNAVVKMPHSKVLPWHQDYSYWPLAAPAAITAWIALDDISSSNGAMQVVPRSHRLGERLPVSFGDARAFMHEQRPGVKEVPQDPIAAGHDTVTYELRPGECGFHDALLWHASTANESPNVRRAFILRYLAEGTIWLGAERFPYDEVGCAIGSPIGSQHFPSVEKGF
jgi:ectoine hydroxylase-related dioxygenase (phytanoyl-CoA dioxygenase family)